MKKNSLSYGEIACLISNSICFLAVLFFYINHYPFLFIFFLLLLCLHTPFILWLISSALTKEEVPETVEEPQKIEIPASITEPEPCITPSSVPFQ